MTQTLTRRHCAGMIGTAAFAIPRIGFARAVLHVGDQKGGARSLMQAAGVLREADYDIEWSLFAGAPMLLQAMNAGAVDLGGIGDAPFAFAQAAGSRVRAVAAERSDGMTTAVIVGRNSPIRTVEDLRHRSIATLRGQTGHFLVLAALRNAGLHPSDVTFVFIPPVAAKAALESGAVDAWATWGPFISQAKLVSGAREIVNGGRLTSGLAYLAATPEAIAGKRSAMRDFIARLKQAQDWARTHQEAYALVWAQAIGFSVPVARDVVRHLAADIIPIDGKVIQMQQQVADFMVENAILASRLDVSKGFDRSF